MYSRFTLIPPTTKQNKKALLYGLRMAISLGVRRLMVYGDSDLVVNQVMKEWDVRSPAMTGYCNAMRKLEKKFEGLELHHIPRLKNQAADDLAKIGSKREAVPSNVFFGTHPHTISSRGSFHRRSSTTKKCHGSD